MEKTFKILWKMIRWIFPYALIFGLAWITFGRIKDYYFCVRHTVDYFAYVCYILVACTALVLGWATWLYRRLKKTMDRLLNEKEERILLLRNQTNSSGFQKNNFPDESWGNDIPEA